MCYALQKKRVKSNVSSHRELKCQMKGMNMKWHLRNKTEHALHTLKCVSKLWIYSLAAAPPAPSSLIISHVCLSHSQILAACCACSLQM